MSKESSKHHWSGAGSQPPPALLTGDGLPIEFRPSWCLVNQRGTFGVSSQVVARRILITENRGEASREDVEQASVLTNKVIREGVDGEKTFVQILDYTELRSATLGARRHFAEAMRARRNVKALIFIGVSPLMEFNVKLGRRFNAFDFEMLFAEDLSSALQLAYELLEGELGATSTEDLRRLFIGASLDGHRYTAMRAPGWSVELEGLTVDVELLNGKIMHTRVRGSVRQEHFEQVTSFFDELDRELSSHRLRGLMIDSDEIDATGWGVRRQFAEWFGGWAKARGFHQVVFYRADRALTAVINLSRGVLPFSVKVVETFEEALQCVADSRCHRGRQSDLPGLPPLRISSMPAEAPLVQELLLYLGSINWEDEHIEPGQASRVRGALEPVYSAIDLIVEELNSLLRERRAAQEELQRAHDELEQRVEERTSELFEATKQIKTLSGLLPICSSCKKIRDDQGAWTHMETYVRDHSEANFSHGICPTCARELYGELFEDE